jgi:hypothetical protein
MPIEVALRLRSWNAFRPAAGIVKELAPDLFGGHADSSPISFENF